jgi:parallel beta-helix repeat protein
MIPMYEPKQDSVRRFARRSAAIISLLLAPLASAATLNVTTYGATGGDSSDDVTAINAAINAATTGDTVYFPNGTYYISASIVAKSGVALVGQARDTAIIKFSGATAAPMINLSNKSFVEVAQLTLDGNNNASVTRGIDGEPAPNAWIHDNRINGLVSASGFGPFGIMFSGSDNVIIEDNIISNIGTSSTWGGGIRVGWGSDYAIIDGNTISNTGRGGIFLNDTETGAVVRHNTITGSGLFNQGLGIELHTAVNNAVVEDNIVDHWISIVISDYNAVRRNTVHATDGSYKSYGLEISSGNTVVTDNWVNGSQHLGISSSPARDYTYYGYNRIENVIQWGMQFQGNSATSMNNQQYFYKNVFLTTDKDNPLSVYPTYAGYGVRIHGYSTNMTFDSNTISGNDSLGINITTTAGVDRISFVNNTITNNGQATIDNYPATAADLEWSGNIVSGNNPDVQLTSRGFANAKPIANFSCPSSVQLGQSVTFTNLSSDPDGTIVHNLWDFGEGVPVTTSSPTYIYQNVGTYRVTLMTTDNNGRSTIKQQSLTVYQGAPDTQAPTAPTNLTSPAKTDTTVSLSWNAATDNFAVTAYEIYNGATLAATTTGTSFQVTALTGQTSYTFTVKAKDAAGNVSASSNAVSVTTNRPPGGGTGTILREYWLNITGTDVATIPVGTTPSGSQQLTSFEGPTNWADSYGARIRGYITPDVTGSYTFWLAADDTAQLWLSSNNDPANKALIASVPAYTAPREWNKNTGQQSSAVTLAAGQSYYVEVLHKEGHTDDNVAVGWTGPGIPTTTVITGGYLTPYGNPPPGDTQAPTAPSSLVLVSKTATTVNLSWSAAVDNVGVSAYDVYRGATLAGSTSGTTFQAAGLTASTSYTFTVKARDAAGNASTASNALTVTTNAASDTQAPTTPSNLSVTSKSTTTVSLTWAASTDNVGVSAYDVYRGATVAGTTAATSLQITGLTPNTSYSFTVKARDAAGNASAASNTVSVTTDASSGGTGNILREYWTGVSGSAISDIPLNNPPTGSDTLTSLEGPQNWANGYGDRIRGYITPTTSGAYTFYIASDNAGELWLSTDANPGNKARIAYVSTYTSYRQWNASLAQQSASINLVGGQRYYVEVLHKEDASGDHVSVGWTGPGISTITVIAGTYLSPYSAAADTQAPTAPTGLNSPTKTMSTVDLSWTASTDNVAVTDYDVYKNGVRVGSTAGATSYQVSGLTANTSYSFTVKAKDAAGNLSAASSTLSVTTVASADTQSPTAPSNLASPAKTSTTVNLTWTASTDNVSVTAYDVYRGSVLAGTTSSTSFQVTGLTASTAYAFTVKARDAAGNVSAASGALSVTTSANSGGAGTIVREYWTGISGDSVAVIPLSTTPTGTAVLTSLEGPQNWANGYGDRIRGYITPTTTGAYTFYIASDNAGELWLSTDSNPAKKSRIAYVATYTSYRQWTASPTQQSAAINLVAGQQYYVEVLHKEDASGDHVSVGWTGPGIASTTVVPGSVLSPY